MSVSNFHAYSDDDDIFFHDENVVIICEPDAKCFGSDPVEILRDEKMRVDDHPATVDATPEPNGLDLAQRAGTEYRSQMELLVNSLWLIHYPCLLERECAGTIANNARLVPRAGHVVIWVDCEGSREDVKAELEGIIPQAYIKTAESEFRRHVWGYLNNNANPENGKEDLRDWSQKVLTKLENIDPDQ
ncbi:hypothetical protein EI982_00750 (plasmid) [Haloplanus rallus]|uniref:Uncharacterized protein n=1 Tax=Haloplanus rallus TaxID=1816183 RepID=A0A6B9FDZ5_9EURY|nr:hypothetical protein [Haloplanus rallus]QGX93403.1 hypothetical protein EI982_00750 [Haloplanus rallus]